MNPDLVRDRDSFLMFLRQLRADLHDAGKSSDWGNPDLASFLEAMEAWAGDWPQPFPDNPWQYAATLLAAARIYE